MAGEEATGTLAEAQPLVLGLRKAVQPHSQLFGGLGGTCIAAELGQEGTTPVGTGRGEGPQSLTGKRSP